MTTPIRPVPKEIDRWISRAAWLRRIDAVVAWLGLWGALVSGLAPARPAAVLSVALVGVGFMVRPVRALWRPVSGCVGLAASRGLQPVERGWDDRLCSSDL